MTQEMQDLRQAIVGMKLDIMCWALPKPLMIKDGHIVETEYDPETTSRLAELDAIWVKAVEAETQRTLIESVLYNWNYRMRRP
jgi:hypothetical protein